MGPEKSGHKSFSAEWVNTEDHTKPSWEDSAAQVEKNQLDTVSNRLGSTSNQLGTVSNQLGSISNQLGTVLNRLGSTSNRLGSVSNQLGSISNRLGPVSNRLGPVSNQIGTQVATMQVRTKTFTSGFAAGSGTAESAGSASERSVKSAGSKSKISETGSAAGSGSAASARSIGSARSASGISETFQTSADKMSKQGYSKESAGEKERECVIHSRVLSGKTLTSEDYRVLAASLEPINVGDLPDKRRLDAGQLDECLKRGVTCTLPDCEYPSESQIDGWKPNLNISEQSELLKHKDNTEWANQAVFYKQFNLEPFRKELNAALPSREADKLFQEYRNSLWDLKNCFWNNDYELFLCI
jgi:hypothetical protein